MNYSKRKREGVDKMFRRMGGQQWGCEVAPESASPNNRKGLRGKSVYEAPGRRIQYESRKRVPKGVRQFHRYPMVPVFHGVDFRR